MEKMCNIRMCFIIVFRSLFFSLLFVPQSSYSQKIGGFDIEGGILVSHLDQSLSFNLSWKYDYMLNSYIGIISGAMFSYGSIDLSFESPIDNNTSYYLDDNKIIMLSGTVGLRFVTPTVQRFGLMADINFLFEPIPYNSVSVDKKYFDLNSNLKKEENKNKMVFTRFNPSFSLQLSLFYEMKQNNKTMRISLGGGITNYNIYNTYYYTKIDNIYLRDNLELSPKGLPAIIFIRLSGF